jgi:hypothetical protein
MKMDLNTAIEFLVEAIKADYRAWFKDADHEKPHVKEMIARFDSDFSIEEGRKYIKLVKGGSVWGFVQKADEGKFKAGDILKAASWASPAKNAARGNVLAGGYSIAWTGPHYLK